MSSLAVTDPRVLAALARVDRRAFLPLDRQGEAALDAPVPIGAGQTTSQPSLIAYQLEQLALRPGDRVLEIGTGCGYQTALLAALGAEVFSVEVVPALHEAARENLARLAFVNVHLRLGDGYLGWPEAAPFAAIIVCAGAARLPEPLLEQLAPGGRLLAPVGPSDDDLVLELHTKSSKGQVSFGGLMRVRFVPLTGARAEADRHA